MSNITLAINDDLLKQSREYAKKHNSSLNALIKNLLKKTVVRSNSHWLDETFQLMDKAQGNSQGKKWSREEIYRTF